VIELIYFDQRYTCKEASTHSLEVKWAFSKTIPSSCSKACCCLDVCCIRPAAGAIAPKAGFKRDILARGSVYQIN
jgi:hypothetical protein